MNPTKKIKFIVPSLVVIAVIGFSLSAFVSDENSNDTHIFPKPLASQSASKISPQPRNTDFTVVEDKNDFVNSVDQRLRLISGRNDLSAYDDGTILAAINDPRVWDFSTAGSADNLPLGASEKEDGRTFFHASPVRVAISIPGDILEISLPELGEALSLEVEQANTPQEGVVSLSGKIQGTSGTFSMTQSNGLIAGHINTSTNTYSFEIFGDTGWVHESGALFTGELPPVISTDHQEHAVNSTLGDSGERIIAKGSTRDTSPSGNESADEEE